MDAKPAIDLFEAIYTTRAMRRLKPDAVDPELIVKVIEAATMGPSGGNRQPWIFIVVRDPALKSFIAERYRKAWSVYFGAEARAIAEHQPHSPRGKMLRSADYLAEHLAEAPALIFACVQRYSDPRRAGQPMYGAIYPSIQNLCLAARGYGLGTSITTMHTMFADEINRELGVPDEYANLVMIPIGYPKGRWGMPNRKPALTVTFWDRWGEHRDTAPES